MEVLLIICILAVFFFVLGETFLPVLIAGLWIIEFFIILCIVFFVVMAILAVLAKKRCATFVRLDERHSNIRSAIYKIGEMEYRNAFPTDAFLKKLLYRKTEVNVRLFQVGKTGFTFDPVSLWIIGIGLLAFSILAFVLMKFILY